MSEDSENKSSTPPPVEAAPETGTSSSWKLPQGFENQIEDGMYEFHFQIPLNILNCLISQYISRNHCFESQELSK